MIRRTQPSVSCSPAPSRARARPRPRRAPTMRRCGEIGRAVEGTAVLVTVRAEGVGCRTARRIVSDAEVAAERGFHCDSAGAEKVCEKGDRRALLPRGSAHAGLRPDRVRARHRRHGVLDHRQGHPLPPGPAVARGAADADPTDPGSYQLDGFRCVGTALDTPLPSALFSCREGDRASVAFIRT